MITPDGAIVLAAGVAAIAGVNWWFFRAAERHEAPRPLPDESVAVDAPARD